MDFSSPLSSPPAESDHDAGRQREASVPDTASEMDLVLTSPRRTPPPPSPHASAVAAVPEAPAEERLVALHGPQPHAEPLRPDETEQIVVAATPAPASPEASNVFSRASPAKEDADEAATVPAVTTTRSGRRVVRKNYADDSPAKPAAASPRAAKTAKTTRAAAAAAARWKTESVLTSTRSPLVGLDLRTLLCQPAAWAALDAAEQRAVLALLPPSAVVVDRGTPAARPDTAALQNDNNFRHDCARYRADLQAGFHNKQWLAEAFAAHAMRRAGVFDAYVRDAFARAWGVAAPGDEEEEEENQQDPSQDEAPRKRSRPSSPEADAPGEPPVVAGRTATPPPEPPGPKRQKQAEAASEQPA